MKPIENGSFMQEKFALQLDYPFVPPSFIRSRVTVPIRYRLCFVSADPSLRVSLFPLLVFRYN
jgi:hypothetical protein